MTYLGKGFIEKGDTKHGYTIGGKAEQLNNISNELTPYYVVIPTEIEDKELPNVVHHAYTTMNNWEHQLYAVRSSAVGEDGEGQSYAGIFESKLNVPATGLELAVREIRESASGGRAKAYDVLKDEPYDVAVIIMKMVDARYSGVLFSKEPVEGTDRMLVEYEEGVGGVVDGESDSHMLFLDSRNFHLSEKNLPYLSGKSTLSMDSPIHHKALKTIWEEAKRLENNYRRPVDIEWAIDKKGKPWVLQVRPITAMKETA